jgi:hypothetical protein
MSKKNNMNPDIYYDGDRNHQGEGILQERARQALAGEEAKRRQAKAGRNFIPGAAPVGVSEKKKG